MSLIKFEYLVFDRIEPDLLQTKLNLYGSSGWELIHLQPVQEIAETLQPLRPKIRLYYHLTLIRKVLAEANK